MSPEWVEAVVNDVETSDEQRGSKEKLWLTNQADGSMGLFKYARGSGSETRGEDWAEWIAQHLAAQLGVPCAQIVPARIGERRGIISRSVLRQDSEQRLTHGNSLLSEMDPLYDSDATGYNPRYTIDAIKRALDGVDAPISFVARGDLDGFEAFTGYLLLDAWMAGRDRHHENWAVISEQERRTLSPSYDHGNALAFAEQDTARARMLANRSLVDRWARRGRSRHFAGRPSLVELASHALALSGNHARLYWRSCLETVDWREVEAAIYAVPSSRMSEVSRTFALELLRVNMRRLFDAYPDR